MTRSETELCPFRCLAGQGGSTPLGRAVSRGHATVVAALLHYDAVVSPADVTAAVDNGHAGIADALLTHVRDMGMTE